MHVLYDVECCGERLIGATFLYMYWAGGEDDDDEEEAGDVQFTWNDKSQPGDEGMDENLAANGGMTDKIKEVNKHTEVADNKNDGLLDMFSFSPSAPTKLHGQPGRVAVPAALKLNITTEDTLEVNGNLLFSAEY